jgi:acyl carrier protein
MKAAVAEKTGYPVDMLEGRMDLEADLGIDSIKRVEILASVQEKVPGLPELDNEKMAALRTLAQIIDLFAGAAPRPPRLRRRRPRSRLPPSAPAAPPWLRVRVLVGRATRRRCSPPWPRRPGYPAEMLDVPHGPGGGPRDRLDQARRDPLGP